ncbi:uncharacterized protein Triagg1_4375 [Trichoderma aggressivum f. europaeum]|uniref:Uracil permease n=1 Tax=Trichoderma aggressivum f. europaeum TaxID=173218 RepID=A0AAE1IGA7_9HYPO|nr:hypothetical protein Triagg1_4375 [Trichoderma aggressivum f. europaeum]
MAGSLKRRLKSLNERVRLHGDESQHEQTDSWSNRDLIPLPPHRRTWEWIHYFGYGSYLSIATWQTPNTFLTQGLSVGQSMLVIVIGALLILLFMVVIAWCGLKYHVGFTVQSRFSWGLRASYIALLQRILLNFIWSAVQCWTGGKLAAVCITAIWPSFATMANFLPASMPATGYEFIGFIVFWVLSSPFLLIAPEKYKLLFQLTSLYCGLGMLSMMIWALATAKGAGTLWTTGQTIPTTSSWNSSWLIMMGINQMIGNFAAGLTNSSDFSRYSRSWKHYVGGSFLSGVVVGVLVCFCGLVTTSAAQKIYGDIYWNPPDLLMVMMDSGRGSSKSRAGVFFLSFGFALTSMFQNVCGNLIAGGIDLAGLFPNYINIRRGAIMTFVAIWVVQPWQLINTASAFINVLSSFSVFLSPIMGIMATDFFLLRHRKIQVSHLYRPYDSSYWFWHGINWRAIPAWLCGWAPTIGGLVVTSNGTKNAPRALYQLFYMAFLIGFFISSTIFYILNKLFPVEGYGKQDEVDVYGAFTASEAAKLGIVSITDAIEGKETSEEKNQPLESSEKID